MTIPIGISRKLEHHSIPAFPPALGRSGIRSNYLESGTKNPVVTTSFDTSPDKTSSTNTVAISYTASKS